MSRSRVLRTAGRVAALVLLLTAFMGPWTFDSHPSTQESCSAPLVWLGNGLCACLVSPAQLLTAMMSAGPSGLFGMVWLFFLPLIPLPGTLLVLLAGERRRLRACYLASWALVAALSAFMFVRHVPIREAMTVRLWGVWLCGAVALAVLAGEILAARTRTGKEPRPAAAGAD